MSETQQQLPPPSFGTRFFAFCGAALVIAFAAVIAAVPFPVPSRQSAEQPTTLSAGDNAWMIVATTFVLALTPALAFLYGTLHGSDLGELLRNVTVVGSLVTFLWIMFSFSLGYGKDAKGNGIMGYPGTFYFFADTFDHSAELNGVPSVSNSIFAVYELGFAIVTAALVTISVAGRVNLNSFLIFMLVWHLIVYTPVAHIVWSPRGAFFTNYIRDFSGALVVHILSSVTSLSLHFILGKDEIPRAGPVAPHHHEQALSLTFVVWFLWFGFNAGKAHEASPVATQSVVNTIAATFISALMGYFYNTALDKPYTSVSLSNAVLIGLVGITPASGYVTVGGAMVISIFTYLFTTVVGNFLVGEGNGVHESLSTLSIHSIAATVGFIWTAILSYKAVDPNGQNGLTYGRGIPLSYQLAGLIALWSVGFICTFILAWIVNLIAPLKNVESYNDDYKAPEQQVEGGEVVHAEEGDGNKQV